MKKRYIDQSFGGNWCGIYESNFIDALKALITHQTWLDVQFIDPGIQINTFFKNHNELIFAVLYTAPSAGNLSNI